MSLGQLNWPAFLKLLHSNSFFPAQYEYLNKFFPAPPDLPKCYVEGVKNAMNLLQKEVDQEATLFDLSQSSKSFKRCFFFHYARLDECA